MSNANNDGRQGGEDDARATSRALFNALDPAMRALLLEEARRRDAHVPQNTNAWDSYYVESSDSRGTDGPANSRGYVQHSTSRERFPSSNVRGNDQPPTSRVNFHSSFQPVFIHGRNSAIETVNAERRGGFSSSSAPRTSRGDITPGLTFSIANRNPYAAVDAHDIYDRPLGPFDAEGMQKLQCASPLAKVKKIVFHADHFVATMDDNTFPNIASASFGEFITVARADVCFTAHSSTHDLAPYCTDGWATLLAESTSINAFGQLNPVLLRSMFQNLGGGVDALGVTPTAAMEMDSGDLCGLIPDAAAFITLDATKFAHGDTVIAIESLVNSRRDKVKMVRLLLMTDRFPMPERLGNLLQSLETVTQTISCVTVLVNMPPTDDAVTSVRTQGFSRGPIHRRGQNDLFHMYARVRGERVIAIGFKQNS